MGYEDFLTQIPQPLRLKIRLNEPLRLHSNWSIGGSADLFCEPDSEEELCILLRAATGTNTRTVTIGTGCNLLFPDAGVRVLVIKISQRFSGYQIRGNLVSVRAGTWVPQLAHAVGMGGLSGIEHTIGIPGTFAGLIVMNGGSLRKSIGDSIETVRTLEDNGEIATYAQAQCDFSYRSSIFQRSRSIILSATLQCALGDKREILHAMLEIIGKRRRKFPFRMPNCGSVFVSSPEMYESYGPPGKLIEDAGLKGVTVGGAQISNMHANFIVNQGNARAEDILQLIQQMRSAVFERTGQLMKTEVRYLSADGEVHPVHDALG